MVTPQSSDIEVNAATKHAQASTASSSFSIKLHPLPILNISEHHTRAKVAPAFSSKIIGALLGVQSNREVSIVNSFELRFADPTSGGSDDAMGETSTSGVTKSRATEMIDAEFLISRRDQFKQVFPTLEVVGWYTTGLMPGTDDVMLHHQFAGLVETPIFVIFNAAANVASQDLPIRVFEAGLGSSVEGSGGDEFEELDYGIETGEAERIAVDGVAKGTSSESGEDGLIGTLTTQRNATLMLQQRIHVLLQYVSSVIDKSVKPDHTILRQIAALVATLPTINTDQFQAEFQTEYTDVQLTTYLSKITNELAALAEYSDKHNLLHAAVGEDFSLSNGARLGAAKGFNVGSAIFGKRRP